MYSANAVGFCVGAVVNVVLIRTFVFPDSRFRLGVDVLLTTVANGAMLGVGMGILWMLMELALVGPHWAKLVANGMTFVLNYLTRAVFFRKR